MLRLNRNHALTLLAVSVAFGVSAPVAAAGAAPAETITMNWQTPYVTSAPYVGTGTGTFSASGPSINDSGSLTVPFNLGASPSPSVLSIHSDRTLTGTLGTITLHCNEIAHNFTNPAAVPLTGNCTVTGGSGAYAGLHGHGTMTGSGDTSDPTTAFVTEALQLSTP
jgi:hypothetical protein